jgi:nitrate reductase delta subunit
MQVLADLAGVEGESFVIAPPDNPDDLEALDAAWAEEQIRFDSPAAPDACPQAAEMVARFNIPASVRSPAHG